MNVTQKSHRTLPQTLYACCCLLLAALFFLVVLQKAYTIFAYDTPKELREVNTVAFAHQFAYGQNPYALAALEKETPPATSIYGFLPPLLMSPFLRLLAFTPLNPLQTCELLTLLVEILGAFSFFRVARRKTRDPFLAIAGTLLFYSCYWRYSAYGGAFADQWGLSLSMLLMDLVCLDEEKGRYRPALYALCLTGLFFTKQYFLFCAAGLCVYLLLHARKDLVKFMLWGTAIGGLSSALTCLIFPLYFPETLPIAQGQTLTGSSAYSHAQIAALSAYYGLIVLFAAMGLLIALCTAVQRRRLRDAAPYELCQILFILPFVLRIAENQGTNYTYYLQLWYPYVLLYGVVSVPPIRERLLFFVQKIRAANPLPPVTGAAVSALLYLAVAASVIRIHPSFRCDFMTAAQRQAWDEAYGILEQYSTEGELLVTMLLSEYCLENQLDTSNYGQAEYNNAANLEHYKDNKIWRNLFFLDSTKAILQKNISYNESVRKKLLRQSYACVAIVYPGEYHLSPEDITNAGYQVLTTKELMSGKQCWSTVFYVPNAQP